MPGIDLRAAATTASFSTGFIEQVEYTIRPPFWSILIARCRILSCRLGYRRVRGAQTRDGPDDAYPCRPFPSMGDQCFQMPGFFLIVPSPLHGTSHRIRSNNS